LDVAESHVQARVCKSHLHTYLKPIIPKTFIRVWEEITHKKHITGLGYNKYVFDVSFHIPDFSKPIQFRARFLDGVVPEQVD